LATIGPDGAPQVRPVLFEVDVEAGVINIGGLRLSTTQKYRNLQADPRFSFVVDDMTPDVRGEVSPGWGRGVEIRGRAELLDDCEPPMVAGPFGKLFGNEVIRLHPARIISWHIDPDAPRLNSRVVR
jgi:pyridoxamine 5'-phosphate oxidase family protein